MGYLVRAYSHPMIMKQRKFRFNNSDQQDQFCHLSKSGLVGWNVGDRIAIAPTGDKNSIVESETRLISAISDNGDGTTNIEITEPLSFMHLGVESGPYERPDGTTFMMQQRAAVGLLSRNVKFQPGVGNVRF